MGLALTKFPMYMALDMNNRSETFEASKGILVML